MIAPPLTGKPCEKRKTQNTDADESMEVCTGQHHAIETQNETSFEKEKTQILLVIMVYLYHV